jgi:paraquat-inducible protein A
LNRPVAEIANNEDAARAAGTAEYAACPDCGLLQRLPRLSRPAVIECARCAHVLATRTAGRVDLPLALALCALLLLMPAVASPLMSVSTLGAGRDSWLSTGAYVFSEQGFRSLAALVLTCGVVLPFVYCGALVWVLGSLHFRLDTARESARLGWMYRWVRILRPWMMLDVLLIGAFVAYTRLEAVAQVHVDAGGWCLIAATFVLLLALTQLDDRTVWSALPPRIDPPPQAGAMACTTCDLIVAKATPHSRCPRCFAPLHVRKPDSVRRTVALLIAGYLLYIPANLLPVLTLVRFGDVERNTIMSGVFELIRSNLWPLAVIVFVASIVLPMTKLLGLTWMLIAIRVRSSHRLLARTRLFRTIDLIGRWSNIDVFMGSVLVGLLQFGALTSVRAGPGLLAFAAVVVVTMFATITFDPRLMWDAAARRAPA